MSTNPMMEQVGRLIGGLLAGGGEVYLPGVGSLYTEQLPARRVNRREVMPPRRIVSFSSQQRGASLVDELARVLETNGAESDNLPEMAQSVYDRWIARALEEETLTIEGVGVLKHKHFTPDEAFEQRLNPQGSEAVRLPRQHRLDWVFWVGIVAVVCAAVIGIYAWQKFRVVVPESVPMTRLEPAQRIDSLAAPADSAAAVPAAVSAPAPATPASPSAVAPDASGVASMIPGHHYVVMGVFSVLDNAKRAAAEAAAPDVAFTCGVYRFGSKYMISPFESTDESASRLFVRTHADRFRELWVYSAR